MSESVKSLVKALSVVEHLSAYPNGTSLQDIAKVTGINKTSVHRILATLEQQGYVTQPVSSKDYRLTMKLLHVGHAAQNTDVISITRPILHRMLLDLGETVNFIARDRDQIVFKDKLEPQDATFRTRTFVGMHSAMYCSAAGKCFLAYSSKEDQEAYWLRNSETMVKLTDRTIINKSMFFKRLEQIKEQGYALDDEENEAGISCVAVPVFDKSGQAIYAVSISTLTPRLNGFGSALLARKIKTATVQIEHHLFAA